MLLRNLLVLSIFSILFFNVPEIAAGITAVSQIVEIGKDVTDIVTAIKTDVNSESNITAMQYLFNKMEVLGEKVANLSLQLEQNGERIDEAVNILGVLPSVHRYQSGLESLFLHINEINITYTKMLQYMKSSDELERVPFEEFATSIVSHQLSSIPYILEHIYARMFYAPSAASYLRSDNFFELLAKHYMDLMQPFFCQEQKSQQQILLNAFNSIVLTNLKGYILIQYAYMLRKLYGHGNFTVETRLATKRFEERISNMFNATKNIIMKSSNDLWRCDPEIHAWDRTYFQIYGIKQAYLIAEPHLDLYNQVQRSRDYFSFHNGPESYVMKMKICSGLLHDCKKITFKPFQVCITNNDYDKRYTFARINERNYGYDSDCKEGTLYKTIVAWFWYRCICYENGKTLGVKSFNLRPTSTDINNNRVMTGLRLIEMNGLIHFQIQEGFLLPGGGIDVETVHWVPVDNYKITDPKLRNQVDFFTLSRRDLELDLDTLEADDGYILTGIRFQICSRKHVCFEIRVTPFDFETGKLINPQSKSFYKKLKIQAPDRTQLDLDNLDVPTKASHNTRYNTDNMYLTFTLTDWEKDLSQRMVPFFDTLPVASLQPIPLSGAGIYYKAQAGYGGFISPKIKTLKFVKYMKSPFPIEEPSEDSEKEP